MKVFLDTSSLFKLYHRETGTEELQFEFSSSNISTVYLSEITKIEFTSTVWKKVRTKSITELEALTVLEIFESDLTKYTFIPVDSLIVEQARVLISTYGRLGLRTLDSIQLSTCLELKGNTDKYFTADKLLSTIMEQEGLPL